MTILQCSFFRRAADNIPTPWAGTWDQLLPILERTRAPRSGTSGDEAKKSLPAICGTRFRVMTRRARGNAVEMWLILFDFDNSRVEPIGEYWPDPRTGEPTKRPKLRKVMVDVPVTFKDVQEALRSAGVDSCSWSTWSAKPGWPKLRVVVPLAHPVPADRWEAATEWALEQLGFGHFRHGLDLPVLRDTARLNFLPGAPDPASIRRGQTKGEHLAIPLEHLIEAAVPSLPVPTWEARIQAARRAEKEAGGHWFQRYRVGGRPVDFQALDLASMLSSRGIEMGRSQAHGTGSKWRCHCPLAHEHSGGLDDDCAVVIQTPGQWPSFKCAHSHHAHLGLQDVVELIWGQG